MEALAGALESLTTTSDSQRMEAGALRAQARVVENRVNLPRPYSWLPGKEPPANAVRSSDRLYVIRSVTGEIGKVRSHG